jgi:ABC-type nitrate/sulfonate/bicarbonate transport system substrate-binding protein
VLACCAAPASAQQTPPTQPPTPVTFSLPGINIAFLAFYMADDLHLWSDQGLQVKTIMLQGAASTNALIAGSVEFAVSSGSSITRAWAHGQKLHAIATAINQTLEWVMIRKEIADAEHFNPDAPLASRAKILRGKKIAIGGVGSLPDAVLKAVASEAGILPNEVIAAPMQPPEILAAWKTKQIDGFSNSMPYVQQVLLDGTGVTVSDSVQGEPKRFSPIAASMVMARADYCADHAATCAAMIHGIVAAIKIIEEDPPKAMVSMRAHFPGYDDKVLIYSYLALKSVTAHPPLTTVAELENGDLMNQAAGFLKPEEKLADYAPLIDNSFVK